MRPTTQSTKEALFTEVSKGQGQRFLPHEHLPLQEASKRKDRTRRQKCARMLRERLDPAMPEVLSYIVINSWVSSNQFEMELVQSLTIKNATVIS
jgi:hypothetical protein